MTGYIKVRNFEKFQHYKDRNPPWIKLYNDLLDDYEFGCLQDASKMHLIGIWLLASRSENRIPNDPEWIAKRINATSSVDIEALVLAGFITIIGDDSNVLAERKQSACLETEGETETERDKNTPTGRAKAQTDEPEPASKPKPKRPNPQWRLLEICTELNGGNPNDAPRSQKQLAKFTNLLKRHEFPDIEGCMRWLAADDFWGKKKFDAFTVEKQIDRFVMAGKPDVTQVSSGWDLYPDLGDPKVRERILG